MKTLHLLPGLIAAFVGTANLSAQDKDRSPDDPARLMEKAAAAKQAGRFEEARELPERVKQMEAEQREEGNRKKARPEHPKDEWFAKRKQGAHGQESEGEFPAKIRHIMEAVRHLRAAGVMEPAEHLEQQARRMREELEQNQQRRKGEQPGGDRVATFSREIGELREQVRRQEQEIQKLREAVKHRHSNEPETE